MVAAGLTSVCLGWATGAQAHQIESSLERLTSLREGLMVESRFSTGEPVEGAIVRLVPPEGGQPVEVGRIDASGRLGFSLPSAADGSWELQVDAGPGHRDFLEVPVRRGEAQLDQVTEAPAMAPDHWSTPLARAMVLIGGLSSLGGLMAGVQSIRRRGR
jgi:nickel transport protein